MGRSNSKKGVSGLVSIICVMIVFSPFTIAKNRPLISWADLVDGADAVVIGNVIAASRYPTDELRAIMVDISIEKYIKGKSVDDAKLQILMNVSTNPVRVGSRGLFFIRKKDGEKHYRLVDRDVGALEQIAAFCHSKAPGSNWQPGYGVRRHGEFLVDVPKELILDKQDCETIRYFNSHIFSGEKVTRKNLKRARVSAQQAPQ